MKETTDSEGTDPSADSRRSDAHVSADSRGRGNWVWGLLLLAPAFWLGLWHAGEIVDLVTGLRRIRPHETVTIAYWATRAGIFGLALWLLRGNRSTTGGILYLTAIGYPTLLQMAPDRETAVVAAALVSFVGTLGVGSYVCWRKLLASLDRRGIRLDRTGRVGLLAALVVALSAAAIGAYALVRPDMVADECGDRSALPMGPSANCARTPAVDGLRIESPPTSPTYRRPPDESDH